MDIFPKFTKTFKISLPTVINLPKLFIQLPFELSISFSVFFINSYFSLSFIFIILLSGNFISIKLSSKILAIFFITDFFMIY